MYVFMRLAKNPQPKLELSWDLDSRKILGVAGIFLLTFLLPAVLFTNRDTIITPQVEAIQTSSNLVQTAGTRQPSANSVEPGQPTTNAVQVEQPTQTLGNVAGVNTTTVNLNTAQQGASANTNLIATLVLILGGIVLTVGGYFLNVQSQEIRSISIRSVMGDYSQRNNLSAKK